LSDGLKPVHVPGEVVRLPIAKEGREPGQGVGYLDDGTMVVVADATTLVGQEVDVRITSNVQTSVGRMLFASLAEA
ncbi:MAG TPA: TRAM domain-containing protein, partial [Acidimicrobiales bacterium]